MEVTQFTYYQQVGGIACDPVAVEITYGTERLAMYLQGVESVYDLVWNRRGDEVTTYGDVHKETEYEFSKYHFEVANTEKLFQHFDDASAECKACLDAGLPLPAYDQCMIASHAFNVLDARKAVPQAQRQNYILKVRELSIGCAQLYKEQEAQREARVKG
jgi:glycyl-tRNA synthetase alpha chain